MVDVSQIVVDDRADGRFLVHRSAFTSEEVLALEKKLIFDAGWLYVGHESEVPNPNDFLTRQVGGRPTLVTRDRSGRVRVMLNTCRHRGAEVCREPRGSSRVFTCFYHGWAFDNSGKLVSVPDGDGYSAAFDRSELGLVQPRVEAYRGFVFVNFSGTAAPLPDYLGEGRLLLDLLADQSADGVRIVAGQHNYAMDANWKLLMENGIDGQHGMTVHQTYFEMMGNLGSRSTLLVDSRVIAPGIDLGNGHSMTLSPELGSPFMNDEVKAELLGRRQAHVERLGEEYTTRMLHTTRNVNIFPSLVAIDVQFGIQLRTMYPVSPGHTVVTGWQLAPSDISDTVLRYRMTNAMTFWGPAGLATPDDLEALEQAQRGFSAQAEVGYSDMSRGIGKADPRGGNEIPQRAFWRAWNERINGVPYAHEGEPWDRSYLAGSHA